jgi:hypothetical protein
LAHRAKAVTLSFTFTARTNQPWVPPLPGLTGELIASALRANRHAEPIGPCRAARGRECGCGRRGADGRHDPRLMTMKAEQLPQRSDHSVLMLVQRGLSVPRNSNLIRKAAGWYDIYPWPVTR